MIATSSRKIKPEALMKPITAKEVAEKLNRYVQFLEAESSRLSAIKGLAEINYDFFVGVDAEIVRTKEIAYRLSLRDGEV
jgi:hypothetical protein